MGTGFCAILIVYREMNPIKARHLKPLVGAPRPAASPFLAQSLRPLRVRAQSFTPGENDPFRCRRWLSSQTSRSGTQTDWKKDRVCAVRGGAPPLLSVYSEWRQESNISSRLLLKGHRIRSVKAVVF
jgi:hypothetical protein